MLEKIWRFINSPLIVVAIIFGGLYFMFAPRAYTSHEVGNIAASMPAAAPPNQVRSDSKNTTIIRTIGDRKYFGYHGKNTYESKLSVVDVTKAGALDIEDHEPPISPGRAVILARAMLREHFPDIPPLELESVSLESVTAGGYYVYLVHFHDETSGNHVGLRVVVLMDGTVIVPSVSDDGEQP